MSHDFLMFITGVIVGTVASIVSIWLNEPRGVAVKRWHAMEYLISQNGAENSAVLRSFWTRSGARRWRTRNHARYQGILVIRPTHPKIGW